MLPCFAATEELRSYAIVGDAIPEPLTPARGDVARGRALIVERSSTCILCHSGPFPEQKFQGDLAPDLSGSGRRWSEGQLRLRLVDAPHLNAATIMVSMLSSLGDLPAELAFCLATGNTARMTSASTDSDMPRLSGNTLPFR